MFSARYRVGFSFSLAFAFRAGLNFAFPCRFGSAAEFGFDVNVNVSFRNYDRIRGFKFGALEDAEVLVFRNGTHVAIDAEANARRVIDVGMVRDAHAEDFH